MVFQGVVAEEGADAFKLRGVGAGEPPCGGDGGPEGIVASRAGADEHEVQRVDVTVGFFEGFEKSRAATARVFK